ncbi:MAG: hypothetical protein ACO35Q_04400 [Prochlorothrix sp.]
MTHPTPPPSHSSSESSDVPEYPASEYPETIAGAGSQPHGPQPGQPSPDYQDRLGNAFSANFPENRSYSPSNPPPGSAQATKFYYPSQSYDYPSADPQPVVNQPTNPSTSQPTNQPTSQPTNPPPGTFQPIGPRDRSVPPPPDLYRHRHGYPPPSPQFSQPSPHLPPQPYPTPAPYPEAYPAAAPPAYAAPGEYANFNAHAADRPPAAPSAFSGGEARSTVPRDRCSPSRRLVITVPEPWSYPWPIWGIFALMLGGILLLLGPGRVFSSAVHKSNDHCQEVIQPQAVISRAQLAQILTVPERDPKQRIQSIIAEPYCILPSVQIRAGTLALREAYPLEFDPETWLIILYEGDEYAGYRFLYR